MGIRFACHVCGKHLNIKNELAGRRGICPACSSRFRIPLQDAERSTPVEQPKRVAAIPTIPTAASSSPMQSAVQDSEQGSRLEQVGVEQSVDSGGGTAVAEAPQPLAAFDLLVSDPTATWYVRPPSGGQYGPATGEILRQWIGEGRVASSALLWRDGWPQWREATEALPELAERLPDAPVGSTAPATMDSLAPNVASAPVASKTVNPGRPSPAVTGDNFGYEDSEFASVSSNGYTTATTPGRFTGRDTVGAERRAKAARRTLSIVMLGLAAIILVGALMYVMTK